MLNMHQDLKQRECATLLQQPLALIEDLDDEAPQSHGIYILGQMVCYVNIFVCDYTVSVSVSDFRMDRNGIVT